ncbi:hypothetical protein CYY_002811 [Polysphondylium violaceum]|uniref:Uncharacterized protein n=1 Tax=Polysphondylium violaceum TaxID=133409 RepID=A0A8J4PYQ2_9MYCE|nr:hypothetical protein CYY_002811 [Polysphondylium violaceum]
MTLSHFDIDYYNLQKSLSHIKEKNEILRPLLKDSANFIKYIYNNKSKISDKRIVNQIYNTELLNTNEIINEQFSISIITEKIISDFKNYFSQLDHIKVSIDIQQIDSCINSINTIINRETKTNIIDYSIELLSKLNDQSFLPKPTTEINNAIQSLQYLINNSNNSILNFQTFSDYKISKKIGILYSLGNILDELINLKKENNYFIVEEKRLVYHGYQCSLSTLNNLFLNNQDLSCINEIVVIGLDQMSIDCNFTRHSTSLAIYSPKWVINDAFIIDLSGQDGDSKYGVYDKEGNGLHGENATPGGHFIGVGDKINLNNLLVLARGGNGGNGSDGRKGDTPNHMDFKLAPKELFLVSNKEKHKSLDGWKVELDDPHLFVESLRDFVKTSDTKSIPIVYNDIHYLSMFKEWWIPDSDKVEILIDRFNIESKKLKPLLKMLPFSPISTSIDIVKDFINLSSDFNSIDLWCTLNKTIVGEKGRMENGQDGKEGLNGLVGDSKIIEKEILISLSLNKDCNIKTPQIKLIEIDQTKDKIHTVVNNERSRSINNNKNNNKNKKLKNNFISSRMEFIKYVLNLNNNFKHIDIISTPYIKSTINNVPKLRLNEIISRLISISTCYSENHNEATFLSFYYQLKEDLSNYLDRKKDKDLSYSVVYTIKFIYQLICSSIFRFKSCRDVFIVTNIKPFLNVIKENIITLESLKKMDILQMYRESYKTSLQEKINQGILLINQLEKDICKSQDQIGKDIENIIQESHDEIKKSEKEKEKLILKKQQLKKNIFSRMGLNVARVGCKAISFFDPTLGILTFLVENSIGLGTDFAFPTSPDLKTTHLKPVNQLDANKVSRFLDKLHDKEKNSIEQRLEALEYNNNCREYAKQFEMDPSQPFTPLDVSNKDIESRIKQLDQHYKQTKPNDIDLYSLKKLEIDYLKIKKQDISTKKKVLKSLKDGIPNFSREQVETSFQIAYLGLSIIKEGKNSFSKIQQVNQLLEENKKMISIYSNNIYTMNQFKNKQTRKIKKYLASACEDLSGKSLASLQIQKLEIKKYLRNIKSIFQSFSQGDNLCLDNTVKVLMEGIENMIQIYERIETYKEQLEFSNFIVNTTSDDPFVDIESKYKDRVKVLRELTTRNVLVDQYNKAKVAFSQYSFPFSSFFFQDKKFICTSASLSSHYSSLEIDKQKDQLVMELKSSINNLIEFIDMDVSTINLNKGPSPDENIINDNFCHLTRNPFYSWDSQSFKVEIKKLMDGDEVHLSSDIKYCYYDVVKFSQVYLTIECNDPLENAQLQSLLSNVNVVLTHSGKSLYKFNYKIYEMKSFASCSSSNGLQLIHRYGNLESTNQSYKKLASSKPILSPYSNWTIQLIPVAPCPNSVFTELSKYSSNSTLYLNGRGIYFGETRGKEAKRLKDRISDQIHKEYSNIFVPF